MVKTKIVETTERYDPEGRLIEKITREETSEDNAPSYPTFSTTTYQNRDDCSNRLTADTVPEVNYYAKCNAG